MPYNIQTHLGWLSLSHPSSSAPMLQNSRNVIIQGNAKVTNAAADSYICDKVIHNNSPGLGPSPRYISIPMIFKFPRWTATHKLERTEIRLEIMIASLEEYQSKSTTPPKRWDWLTEKMEEYVSKSFDMIIYILKHNNAGIMRKPKGCWY